VDSTAREERERKGNGLVVMVVVVVKMKLTENGLSGESWRCNSAGVRESLCHAHLQLRATSLKHNSSNLMVVCCN
jgi:hypothetical protein